MGYISELLGHARILRWQGRSAMVEPLTGPHQQQESLAGTDSPGSLGNVKVRVRPQCLPVHWVSRRLTRVRCQQLKPSFVGLQLGDQHRPLAPFHILGANHGPHLLGRLHQRCL